MEDVLLDEKNKKNKKHKKIIIIATIFVVIGASSLLFLNKKENKFDGTSISGYILGNGVEPGLTPEEIQALLNKKVDESKVAFSIYSEPVFKGKSGTIMFANPRYSAHNIDLSVTLNGKEIIKTEKIKPDQYIEKISLLGSPLKKGKHNAIASIKAYSQKDNKIMGEVSVDMVITSE